jgi:hypothetical protein
MRGVVEYGIALALLATAGLPEGMTYVVNAKVRAALTLSLDPLGAYELEVSLRVDERAVSTILYDYDTALIGELPLTLRFPLTRQPGENQAVVVSARLVDASSTHTIVEGSAAVPAASELRYVTIVMEPLPKRRRDLVAEQRRADEERRAAERERLARAKAERVKREREERRERWCNASGPRECRSRPGNGWWWSSRDCECYCSGDVESNGDCRRPPDPSRY